MSGTGTWLRRLLAGWLLALGLMSLAAPLAAQPQLTEESPAADSGAAPTTAEAEPEVPLTDATGSEPEYVTTKVRVSPDIGEQREAIIDFINSQWGWEVGETAEFEVVPNPEWYEDLLFSRIKPYSFDRSKARFPSEAMDIAEIMIWSDPKSHHPRFEGLEGNPWPVVPDRPEWGTPVPLPTDLGPADGKDMLARLAAAMAPIARHHALLGMANDTTFSADFCASNIEPDDRRCEQAKDVYAPSAIDGIQTVDYHRPVYIQVRINGDMPEGTDTLNFIAVAPDRSIMPLFTTKPIYAIEQNLDTGERSTYVIGTDDAGPLMFSKMGLYQVVALASAGPIDPQVWTIQPGDALPDDLCQGERMLLLCLAMQGRYDLFGQPSFPAAVETFDVSTNSAIMVAPVGAGLATLSEGRWQAQLFEPRKGPALGTSGSVSPGGTHRLNFEKSHKCGGSYLGDGYILTAAHCVSKRSLSSLQVRLGTLDIAVGGSNFPIVSMVIHKDYGKNPGNADIALLRIKVDSRLDTLLRKKLLAPIPLAPAGERLGTGTNVMITGWGFTGATTGSSLVDSAGNTQRNMRKLGKVAMKVRPERDCLKYTKLKSFRAADIICAKSPVEGRDACFGDSGGPLTRYVGGRRVLVGIVAAGIGCAMKGVPGVYTRVANFRAWIDKAKVAARKPGIFFMDRNGRVVP